LGHFLRNSHRTVALHITVTADGTKSGAWPTEVPPQEKKIRHRLHVGDAVLMLRESHRPARDQTLGGRDNIRRLDDLFARDSAGGDDLLPARAREIRSERVEAICVARNEFAIELISFHQALHDSLEKRDIAVDPHRQMQTRERRRLAKPAANLLR